MPSTNDAQQKFFGLSLALRKGKRVRSSGKARELAKSLATASLAETGKRGRPKKANYGF